VISIEVEWIFIVIFPAKKLGTGCNEWREVISNSEVLYEILF